MTDEIVWAFVTLADSDFIRVKLLDNSRVDNLLKLGFIFDNESLEYKIIVNNDHDKARVFDELRCLDVSFSGGKEWCPSEVFEYLRDQGLLRGNFRKISWMQPNKYHVTMM